MRKYTTILGYLNVAQILFFGCHTAHGQLLGNMALNQEAGAYYHYLFYDNNDVVPVTDSAIPFQTTVSANNTVGAAMTATYNIQDNGTVATIDITCNGSLSSYYNAIQENTVGDANTTTFTLLQPAKCVVTLNTTGPTNSSLEMLGTNNGTYFNLDTDPAVPTYTASGTAYPGNIFFSENWEMGPFSPNSPTSETGTYSLSVTFTAIPEPSSAELVGVSAATLLARRRRRLTADH